VSSPQDLLVVNRDYLPTLLRLLENAEHSVDVLAYSFSIGRSFGPFNTRSQSFQVAQKLAELTKRRPVPVHVRVYLEGERETSERNSVTAHFLKRAGVEIVMGTTHAKGFCIDKKYLLFGSTNLTDQSLRKNNETNLVTTRSSAVKQFLRYFDYYWKGGTHGGIRLKSPLFADGSFKKPLLDLIKNARRTIEFSIYFFDFREVEEALLQAHGRGVKIRGFVHDHRSFALSYVKRTRATVQRLKRAGIRDLTFGPDDLFTHSKFLVADRSTLMIGTGNWLVEDVTTQPQLYFKLSDANLCRELADVLGEQIAKQE
jgi:phosphatidylserine/phosphatidylglycerophosphate/cardiolipin synthase-like enzyme